MKNVQEKINRISELRDEIKIIRDGLPDEMFEFIMESFRQRGFVEDPRGENYADRGLYHPEMKVSVRLIDMNQNSFGITAHPMKNNGLEWDNEVVRLNTGSEVNWNFFTQTFDKYFNNKFVKRVNKMKGVK
jgi:hypothetical protein